MYLSVCVKAYKDFESGEIFNTYIRGKGYFVRNQSCKTGAFEHINNFEYNSYFMELNDEFIFPIPILKQVRKGLLGNRNLEIVVIEKTYRFDTDIKTLCNLHIEVFYQLEAIKKWDFTEEWAEEINELLELLQYECGKSTFENMLDIIKRIQNMTSLITRL